MNSKPFIIFAQTMLAITCLTALYFGLIVVPSSSVPVFAKVVFSTLFLVEAILAGIVFRKRLEVYKGLKNGN